MPGTSKWVATFLAQWPIFGHMDRPIRPHHCREYWMLCTELALSSLSTTHQSSQASHTKHKLAGRLNKMMPTCLKSCNLECCPAQGCGPVGCRRLKSKLFNQYVFVFECPHRDTGHADHAIVGTWSFRNIVTIVGRHPLKPSCCSSSTWSYEPGPIAGRPKLGLGWQESAYRCTGTSCRAASLDCSEWSWEKDARAGTDSMGAVEQGGRRRLAADLAELDYVSRCTQLEAGHAFVPTDNSNGIILQRFVALLCMTIGSNLLYIDFLSVLSWLHLIQSLTLTTSQASWGCDIHKLPRRPRPSTDARTKSAGEAVS